MSSREKNLLKDLIRRISFQKSDQPSFILSSGKRSCYYFNLKLVTCSAQGQVLVGNMVYDTIRELNLKPKAMGGLTMGADPIAYATAFASWLKGGPIDAFSVRKQPKQHGLGLQIEGNVEPGDNVVILEDVITTGQSTIQALQIARSHGLKALAVVALLDRCEEDGKHNIEAHGVKVYPLFTPQDFTD